MQGVANLFDVTIPLEMRLASLGEESRRLSARRHAHNWHSALSFTAIIGSAVLEAFVGRHARGRFFGIGALVFSNCYYIWRIFQIDRAVGIRRTARRERAALRVVSALIPDRIANEELGDALENLQKRTADGLPSWHTELLFWLAIARTLSNSLRCILR